MWFERADYDNIQVLTTVGCMGDALLKDVQCEARGKRLRTFRRNATGNGSTSQYEAK